jgi:hypothetical protein
MKDAHLGDYLLWNGQPAKIIGETDQRMVIIELLENCKCPHCEGDLGKKQIHMIVASLLFQENAEKVNSITDDATLTVR